MADSRTVSRHAGAAGRVFLDSDALTVRAKRSGWPEDGERVTDLPKEKAWQRLERRGERRVTDNN